MIRLTNHIDMEYLNPTLAWYKQNNLQKRQYSITNRRNRSAKT